MSTKSSAALSELPDCDFRSTSWGMTREEVKQSEPAAPQSESRSHLSFSDLVLELDTVVGYHFIDNSLVEAGYAFRVKFDSDGLYTQHYDLLKQHFSEFFGKPIIDEDINTLCTNCEEEKGGCNDSLMLLTEWLTERSIIRMILMGDSERCDFGVLHRSRGHLRVIEHTERSVRWGIN